MSEPLVPPTPPITADAADFEYPLGMPYTLTQWRQAGEIVMMHSLQRSTAGTCLAVGAVMVLISLCNLHTSPFEFMWVLGLPLLLRGLFILLPCHPFLFYLDATVITLLVVPLCGFMLFAVYLLVKEFGFSPMLLVAVLLLAFLYGPIWLCRTQWERARRYAALAATFLPSELVALVRKYYTLLVPHSPDERLVHLTTHVGQAVKPGRLLLLDGYALALFDADRELILLRRQEICLTDSRAWLDCGDGEVDLQLTPEMRARLQAWVSAPTIPSSEADA
jgi:hypothetical protein